jgi:hypothetical protein
LFISANQARRLDPTLAAQYHRLMVDTGKHHNSALCHIATTLLTRIAACWNSQTPYQLRDAGGRPVDSAEARAIIAERYQIPEDIRRARATTGTGRRSKESQRAPSTGPSNTHAKTIGAA